MPYIKREDRSTYDYHIEPLSLAMSGGAGTEGDLNYIVTRLVHEWLGSQPNYARFNGAVGVLECAKLELYRRMVVPYEDNKIAENGDVG